VTLTVATRHRSETACFTGLRTGGVSYNFVQHPQVDTAPPDPSVIDGLSPVELQERAMAAAEKERRRQRRKERKELKRARMGACEGSDGRRHVSGKDR
jgi:hypothetical protein